MYTRHEYDGNTGYIYYKNSTDNVEVLYFIRKIDDSGRVIYEENNIGALSEYCAGSIIVTYEYDDKGRIISEIHDTTEGFHDAGSDKCYHYSYAYEYDGDKLIKETTNWRFQTFAAEYFYDGDKLIKELIVITGGDNELDGVYEGEYLTEYTYSDDGRSYTEKIYEHDGSLSVVTEYELIPKIQTDIEYLEYYDIEPEPYFTKP